MSRIDTPYDPDQCQGEFGWMWRGSDPATRGWELVFTYPQEFDGDDPVLRVISNEVKGASAWGHHADDYAGRPYLSCPPPACEPSAALLVTMRLADGGSFAACWMQDDASTRRDAEAIRAVMTGERSTNDMRAALALIECRDQLYLELRDYLCAECVTRDGVPDLQTMSRAAVETHTPLAVAILNAEEAVGRRLNIPAWLEDALDTWPAAGKATA